MSRVTSSWSSSLRVATFAASAAAAAAALFHLPSMPAPDGGAGALAAAAAGVVLVTAAALFAWWACEIGALRRRRRELEARAGRSARSAEAADQARQRQDRLQRALEATGLGVCDVDVVAGEAQLSPSLAALTGHAGARARMEDLLARVHALDAARILAHYDDLAAGRVARFNAEFRAVGPAGTAWLRVLACAVDHTGEGRPLRVVATVADITRERNLHAQRLFADRLASIGTLAAGVSHEINNPLSYLLANCEFLEQRMRESSSSDAEALMAAREAREGARRVAGIVRGLRVFSRAEAGSGRAAVDLRVPLQSALRMAEPQIRERARLSLDLDEVPSVRGTEHELAQVALNLLVNAAQAVPPGRAGDNQIQVATRVARDGRVALEVRDSGVGIPPHHLPRIFDPFFTAKAVGQGSGLGLAICHGIVERLGGDITVESTPGRGTLFRVLFPAADAPSARGRPTPVPLAPRRGRVLVVDDEPLVCRAVARTLGGEHEVVALTEPAEALARLDAGEHFDVFLCDLMMPGLTGMACYETLQARRPEVARQMVFLTGGAFTDDARSFLERVPNRRVEKPFDAEALRTVIAKQVQVVERRA
jgi:signal transduction histidine kinase/CheY-like chemotaxis protein